MTRSPPRVLFAGGGTGGHLFPGVAVARALVARHPEACVVFAGTGRGVEAQVLARERFRFERVRSTGLAGKAPREVVRTLASMPVAFIDAFRVLRRTRPDVVIGLGGYSAGPVVLLGALTGHPTMVLEQNAVPGVTNRLLAPFVRAAAVSFAATARYFGAKAFVCGNPVRPEFFRPPPATEPRAGGPRLLVVGGSQGAHAINAAMVAAAPALAALPQRLEVTHQTGRADRDAVRDAYRRVGLTARVEAFFDAMEREMHAADVVVCRGGATTLAEIAAAGRPSIIVPLPHATHDHQRRNAAAVMAAGAGEVVEQAELDLRLVERVSALCADEARRAAMARAARELARPDAAAAVVACAERLMGRASPPDGA